MSTPTTGGDEAVPSLLLHQCSPAPSCRRLRQLRWQPRAAASPSPLRQQHPTAGFSPGAQSNCTANTRAVEEGTFGYWYDFYKGDKGRFRQSIQYSYIDKLTWSGITAVAHGSCTDRGNDNVIETSFRYYLPVERSAPRSARHEGYARSRRPYFLG